MPGKSDFLENKTLDHMLGGPDYVRPATVYVALFSDVPSDAGIGNEIAGNAYARVAVTNNAANWPAATGGVKSNGIEIVFPTPSAAWGNVVAFAIFDAAVGGNMLVSGDLKQRLSVTGTDKTVVFPAGTLEIVEL